MQREREFLTLAAEIRQELSSLAHLAEEIPVAWARGRTLPEGDRRAYVESTALRLHNYYTACERIFEKIAGEINGGLPQTPDSHLRLLRTMTVEVPGVRPRVLTPELADRLSDYLRFRHVVRNNYGFELHEERIDPLVHDLAEVSGELQDQLADLLAYLEELGHRTSGRRTPSVQPGARPTQWSRLPAGATHSVG